MYRTNIEASFPNVIVDFRKAIDVIYDKKNNFELGEKIILMGFSAGGHLASLVCRKDIASTYGIPRFKYLVLGYPAISLENNTHIETGDYFLGNIKTILVINIISIHLILLMKTIHLFSYGDQKTILVSLSLIQMNLSLP